MNELVKTDNYELIPFDSVPGYLSKSEHSGMEGMDKDDYKTPRIILLQGLSPELENFPGLAKKDNYWHTGMNVNLGTEFDFVPILANKRVILFRPRGDQNGGILAFSKNGKDWDTGANQEFQIKLKNIKQPVTWATDKNVLASKLTEFGTSNPEEPQSAPAATVIYEYLCYLPKYPELSPCVFGVSKTGIPNGKSFNTSLAMIARTGKPICCLGAKAFTQSMSNSDGDWTVPNFKLMGYVPADILAITTKLMDTYGDYKVDYTQEDTASVIDDNVNF